jgi:hypothetical protein
VKTKVVVRRGSQKFYNSGVLGELIQESKCSFNFCASYPSSPLRDPLLVEALLANA